MNQQTRNSILNRITACAPSGVIPEPVLPPLSHEGMDDEERVQAFIQNLTLLGAEPHRVSSHQEMLDRLSGLLVEAGITRLFITGDAVFDDMGVPTWAENRGMTLVRASDFPDRRAYTDAVFDESTAGFTTVSRAVAESGTLVIAHDQDHARLISLAPIVHIALVRIDQLVPVYETVFATGLPQDDRPSQVTLITGPSMTADIQATPFKGMHGPKRLIVFLINHPA